MAYFSLSHVSFNQYKLCWSVSSYVLILVLGDQNIGDNEKFNEGVVFHQLRNFVWKEPLTFAWACHWILLIDTV